MNLRPSSVTRIKSDDNGRIPAYFGFAAKKAWPAVCFLFIKNAIRNQEAGSCPETKT